MARTKEFDRERALDRAMHVFWRQGYAATSLPDLLRAMGIGRQSMYDTFGDKHALFLEALARYIGRTDATRACFEQASSVRRAFRDMFEAILDEHDADKRRGCFGIHSAVALAPHDKRVAKMIADRQRELEDVFHRALERARASGEIAAAKNARGLARFFVGALQGLRVAATADPSSPALRDIARVSLATLD
ncbi:MAG TPA: TetR/AcrR family transcriptional regulator [Kofleriaceae bacterium]